MRDGAEPRPPRQPIFNIPPMTKALLTANLLVHGLRFLLSDTADDWVVLEFGFAPARFLGMEGMGWTTIVSPVTYQFLHGDLTHLAVNMLGLAAFGAGIEQRLGPGRMLVFYLLGGIAGALAQTAVGYGSEELLIGASAAISALFGGILRFGEMRRNLWTIVAVWLVMNAAVGLMGVPGEAAPIAWIAHVGGFAFGLALFPVFDRFRRGP